MSRPKRYEVRQVASDPPQQGPWLLDVPLFGTDDRAQAGRIADLERAVRHVAIVDRVASTVEIETGATLPLVPTVFVLR